MPSSTFLRRAYGQLPAHTYTGWNNLGDVHRTLQELEFGRFRMAAIMCDQMMRDDRFSAVVDTRIDAADSVPLVVKPGNDSDQALAIATELWNADNQMEGRWSLQFPPEVIAELVQWGILLNFGLAEIIWDVGVAAKGQWTGRLKVWHPQWVRWDWGTRRYKVITTEGEIDLPMLDDNPYGDAKWFVWCPRGYHQAWMKGAVRSVSVAVLERGMNRRNWGRYNEKYGLPIDVLTAPASAPRELKDQTFSMIANRGGETAVMLESTKADDGDEAPGEEWKYDIVSVEGSTGYKTFESRQNMLNTDLAVKILGQNLTTEVGKAGSKAAEEGHDDIRIEKLKKDAAIFPALGRQVLHWEAILNYGDPELAPKPYLQVEQPDDMGAAAETMANVGAGVTALKEGGAPVDERAVLEKFEIPALTPEEAAARAAVEAEQQAEANAAAAGNVPQEPTAEDDLEAVADDRAVQARARGPMPGTSKVARRYTFQGLPIAVETPKGTSRTWRDAASGESGTVTMKFDYGFIEGHVGADGDEVDVYVGEDESADSVYVVHQMKKPDYRRYDEDKVMMGFATYEAARAAYVDHRDDGEKAAGRMSVMPLEAFKKKLRRRKGTGAIRAGASAAQMIATTAALQAFATRARGAIQAAAKSKKPKDLATAKKLTKAAALLGARALAPYLAAVKAEIQTSTSPADLERRLLIAFRNQSPDKLAEVIKRTRILGHLSGDLSVVKQIAA